MLLRQELALWGNTGEPGHDGDGLDAELRTYTRSFAAPLLALAALAAALLLVVWFAELA